MKPKWRLNIMYTDLKAVQIERSNTSVSDSHVHESILEPSGSSQRQDRNGPGGFLFRSCRILDPESW